MRRARTVFRAGRTKTTKGTGDGMTNYTATDLAHKYRISLEKDFFTLTHAEVQCVIDAADEVKYRKPKNANGSRGRYFFAAMQRAARRQS